MSNPKRRWFQIHLSTAVVLMFVASAFIGANVSGRQREDSIVYGWPIACRERPLNPKDRWIDYYKIDPIERTPRLLLDIGIFVAAISGCAIFLEWRIRRREARKP